MTIPYRRLHRPPVAGCRRTPRWRPGLLVILLGLAAAACDDVPTGAPTTPEPAAGTATTASSAVSDAVPAGNAATPTATLPVSLTPAGPGGMADGAIAFYVDGAGLWRMDRGGSNLLVPDAELSPLYPSPDGRWVAFPERDAESQSEALRIISADDGRDAVRFLLRELQEALPEGRDALFPAQSIAMMAWSPEADRFYFTTVGLRASGPPVRIDDLWVVDPEGSGPREILPPGEGGLFAFSPDGSQLALTTAPRPADPEETLAVAEPDGSSRRVVATYPGLDVEGRQGISAEPVWADDGQSLLLTVFAPGTKMKDLPLVDGEVRRFWLDGRQEAVTAAEGYAVRIRAGYGLRASPDATHLAAALPHEPGDGDGAGAAGSEDPLRPGRIVVATLEELAASGWSGVPAYDEGDATFFDAWSPDGRRFTYSVQRDVAAGQRGELHVGTLGEAPRRIVEDARLARPHWVAPDQLLLLLEESEPWLVLVELDGGMTLVARLTPLVEGQAGRPSIAVVPVP